jgi:hypothetical protein
MAALIPQPGPHGFERAAAVAAYLYLLRVPILVGAVLVLLPLAALWPRSPLVPLLQNVFFLDVQGTFWSVTVALILSWSVLLTGRLVLLNGGDRFALPQIFTGADLTRRSVLTVTLLALPAAIGPFTQLRDFQYTGGELAWRAGATLAACLAAYVLAFIALWAAVLLSPAGTQGGSQTFPAPPLMRRWLAWANNRALLGAWVARGTRWVRDHWPLGLWTGYLDPATGLPWGGHWLAALFCLATAVVYFGINLYRQAYLGESTPVPALAFVLLLLVNANWVLSFFAFLLDRYRLPLIVPIVILCVLGTHAPSSDHYYATQRGVSIAPIFPEQVLAARRQLDKPIIVVATAGGGIQAAAWTTQVLAGLEEQTGAWGGRSFAESVALISSVSGGATGAMYYVNRFHPERREPFESKNLAGLTAQAWTSSLDDIGWALVYRDLPRIFFPYMMRSSEQALFDRGFMLEESWRNRGNIQGLLSNWRTGVAEGRRPAAIFNATIAETGEPLALATTEVRADTESFHRRTFYELYPNTDLPIVTAVRLAATFPFVTPVARALSTKPEYHVADGGYYDNYGISSAIAWLDDGFRELLKAKKPLPPVLVILIRSFPDDAVPAPGNKGWFFQTYAPINALLGVRTTGQWIRGRAELDLFIQRWECCTSAPIEVASFSFQGHNAPLSWSMNRNQIAEIQRQWKHAVSVANPDLLKVRTFLADKR